MAWYFLSFVFMCSFSHARLFLSSLPQKVVSALGPGGIDVVTALLKWNVYNVQQIATQQRIAAGGELPKDGEEIDTSSALEKCPVVQTVSAKLPEMVKILSVPAELDRRGKRAFGTARLKLLQMLVSYLSTGPYNKNGTVVSWGSC